MQGEASDSLPVANQTPATYAAYERRSMHVICLWHKSKMGNICYWMPSITGREGTVRLTIYTDYSLRLLMYLAVRDGGLVTIGEVAGAYGIAKNHLTKVVHQLGVAGDIETVRGKGGGIRLKKPAESINLGAVIRRTEPDLALVPCFDGVEVCAISKVCLLQATLHDALAAFLAVLDRTTLADVVTPRRKLAALLGLWPTEASRGRATATQRAL